jgi:thiol-disulfide isomerase/thioredoxin
MRSLLALLLTPLAVLGAEGWLTDFEAAKKQAAAEKKDILVDFTGSDWCGWCIKLDKEVFSTDAFKAQKDFVLVALDFPRRKEIPADQKAANEALMRQWGVRGFPTIILANAKGEPYARTGYKQGGPESYLPHLAELRKQNTPAGIKAFGEEQAAQAAAAAKEAERGAKLKAAVESGDFAAVEKLIDESAAGVTGERLSMVNYQKAMLSIRVNPENRERALGFMDKAIAAAGANDDIASKLREIRSKMETDPNLGPKGK